VGPKIIKNQLSKDLDSSAPLFFVLQLLAEPASQSCSASSGKSNDTFRKPPFAAKEKRRGTCKEKI